MADKAGGGAGEAATGALQAKAVGEKTPEQGGRLTHRNSELGTCNDQQQSRKPDSSPA